MKRGLELCALLSAFALGACGDVDTNDDTFGERAQAARADGADEADRAGAIAPDGDRCPAPARVCEALCRGEDIAVPRGCPQPQCRCPEPPAAPAPVAIRLLWGQIPGALPGRDEDGGPELAPARVVRHLREVDARALPRPRPHPLATNWAGSARGQGVRVEVLDTVRFEGNDRVRGCRPDAAADANGVDRPCTVAQWKTRTTISHDGLILRFSPIRGQIPRAVVFDIGPFEDVVVPYRKLADLNGLVIVGDRAGNLLSVASVELGRCAAGFVEGLWLSSAPHQGGYAGLWYGHDGTLGGSMQGVYRPGPLAYGVFRDLDGTDIAFGDGTYGSGEFEMTGRNVLGEPVASLWGHYGGGFYHGGFAIDCGEDGHRRPALADPAGRRRADGLER